MAKKQIEPKHELIKFISNLYSEDIQLNFCEYFILTHESGTNYKILFPVDEYYYIDGMVDMADCPSFCNWLTETGKCVLFNNSILDEFRKLKMKDFSELDITESEYSFILADGNKITFTKQNLPVENNNSFNFNFEYSENIPSPIFDQATMTCYQKGETLQFEMEDGLDIIFDSPIKNMKMKFKKVAEYKIFATTKNADGIRIVMLQGQGKYCRLNQYFKVV